MERKVELLALLEDKKEMTTNELINYFQVSGATIRADLAKLEEQNQIRRVHGGAVYIGRQTLMESFESFVSRSQTNVREKNAIALKAVELITDSSTIMMDASSTVLHMTNYFEKFNRLTVISNGIQTAIELQKYRKFHTILVGGTLRYNSTALEGLLGADILNNLNADILFTSAHGFTTESGLSDYNPYEVELKSKMVNRSKQIIALLDYRKIGKVSTSSFCPTSQIHTIITDNKADSSYLDKIRKLGINVIIADI